MRSSGAASSFVFVEIYPKTKQKNLKVLENIIKKSKSARKRDLCCPDPLLFKKIYLFFISFKNYKKEQTKKRENEKNTKQYKIIIYRQII